MQFHCNFTQQNANLRFARDWRTAQINVNCFLYVIKVISSPPSGKMSRGFHGRGCELNALVSFGIPVADKIMQINASNERSFTPIILSLEH